MLQMVQAMEKASGKKVGPLPHPALSSTTALALPAHLSCGHLALPSLLSLPSTQHQVPAGEPLLCTSAS